MYTAMIQLAYGRLFTDVALFTFNYYSALFHFCVFASRKAKPSQAKPKTSKKRRRENSAQRCDECNLIQPSIQQLTAVSLFSFRLSLFFFLLCFSLTILPFVLSFAFFFIVVVIVIAVSVVSCVIRAYNYSYNTVILLSRSPQAFPPPPPPPILNRAFRMYTVLRTCLPASFVRRLFRRYFSLPPPLFLSLSFV